MECMICKNLEKAYDVVSREYSAARSSSSYPFSRKFAAVKNVDMQRARYELEEHRVLCVLAGNGLSLPAKPESSPHLRRSAA
jgi:hypothetical protein